MSTISRWKAVSTTPRRSSKACSREKEFADEIGAHRGQFHQFRAHRRADASIISPPPRSLGKPATFVVPTGNFGDIFAGEAAERMGLAAERLVIATNANDIMARALNDGVYAAGAAHHTVEPVDGHPGRLQFRARAVRGVGPRRRLDRAPRWNDFARDRQAGLAAAVLDKLRARYSAIASDDDETLATINAVYRHTGRIIDPHTAVASPPRASWALPPAPVVVLSTAHPAKFPDAVTAGHRHAAGRAAAAGTASGRTCRKAGNPAQQALFDSASSSLLDWRHDHRNIKTFQWLDDHHGPDGQSGKRRLRRLGGHRQPQ